MTQLQRSCCRIPECSSRHFCHQVEILLFDSLARDGMLTLPRDIRKPKGFLPRSQPCMVTTASHVKKGDLTTSLKYRAPPLSLHLVFLWEQITSSVTDTRFLQTRAWDTWKFTACPWWFTLFHSFSVTPFSIYAPPGKMLSEELTIEEVFTKRNAYSVAKLYPPNRNAALWHLPLLKVILICFCSPQTSTEGLFWSPYSDKSDRYKEAELFRSP